MKLTDHKKKEGKKERTLVYKFYTYLLYRWEDTDQRYTFFPFFLKLYLYLLYCPHNYTLTCFFLLINLIGFYHTTQLRKKSWVIIWRHYWVRIQLNCHCDLTQCKSFKCTQVINQVCYYFIESFKFSYNFKRKLSNVGFFAKLYS